MTAVIGVASGAVLAPAFRADAAKRSADLDVSFAPPVVEARTPSQAFVLIRNSGAGVATLGLGDTVSVSYAFGETPGSLAATGSRLTAVSVPPGAMQSDPADPGAGRAVARLVVQTSVTIDAGTTLLLPFDFVAGAEGDASVVVDLKLGKGAGRYPRRIQAHVAKSHPRSDVFYGDGSGGALTITSDQAFPPLGNWTDVLIDTGATVTVAAGATIRCAGTFENRGTIVVLPGSSGGGERIDNPSGPLDPSKQYAAALVEIALGDAIGAPSRPSVMQAQASSGGFGGVGLGAGVYQLPLSHYRRGGGGGSGALGAIGGDGGGLVRIVARGEIRNSGAINAAGAAAFVARNGVAGGGGGGGAGGIVILASASKVSHTGTIDVRGANGGGPDFLGASGGGGGGGLIVLAAPIVPAGGTLLFNSGATPSPLGAASGPLWAGGGGGGACVGDGGDGYGVGTTGALGVVLDSQGGTVVPHPSGAGQVLVLTVDPRTVW